MKTISDSLTADSKIALAIAFTCGYLIDTILRNTILKGHRVRSSKHIADLDRDSSDDEEDYDDDDDDENDNDNDECLRDGDTLKSEDYKMVLVINSQLKMGKGKVAAQCAHAAVVAFKTALGRNPLILRHWSKSGQAKITVKADDDKELMCIARKAKEANLITEIIQDAGRTQIVQGSKTVCVVGPGPSRLIDKITGTLKLY